MRAYAGIHRVAILAAVLTPFCLGVVERAAAEDPAGCSLAGTSVLMTRSPSGPVDHGDTICYTVCYGAPAFPSCNITDFSADLFFPDGSSVNVVSGASIDVGTQFCCGLDFNDPADPRCATHSDAEYCYTVAHDDEVTSFAGCPPVPSGDSGKVVAYTQGSGVAQTPQVDAVAPCATANNEVIHGACCEPCTGTCTDGVTANECPTDSNFMPGMLCSEINCSLDCNDANACSTDCCVPWDRSDPDPANWMAAFCTNLSVCEDTSCDEGATPLVCEDNDVCTQDSCDDTAVGCCLFEDIPCDPRECFNNTGCDPVTGCQYESVCVADPNYCDDNDVCTMDVCDDTEAGCCIHNDIPCDPRPCFEITGCDPITGCQYTSVCSLDPNYCDDSDVCTADTCDPALPGCCGHEDIPCDPRECFNNVGCDPVTGCQYESICVADPNYCDDADVCTMDICDDTVGGCCIHNDIPCDPRACFNLTGCDPVNGCMYEPVVCADPICDACNPDTGACEPIDPPPAGCGGGDGCTPGFWKQPQHLQYWVGFAPDDLFDEVFGVTSTNNYALLKTMWTGGGGEKALGRHAVAALLNASSDEVSYAYSVDQVIGMVQEAYATGDFNGIKDMLEMENERGCTVDKSKGDDGPEGDREQTRLLKSLVP